MSGPLILASASPRRREILTLAGIAFEAVSSSIEERQTAGEDAEQYVLRLAREKAEAVAAKVPRGGFILGADTEVEVDGQVLGKPESPEHAARMLGLLSGRAHRVITGICVLDPGGTRRQAAEITQVYFHALSAEEIGEYVRSGQPMDKAGAYAIQGLAAKFVERIEGCYFNVMGLPVARVYRLLKESGWTASSARRPERSEPS
jgi:septum formation protein